MNPITITVNLLALLAVGYYLVRSRYVIHEGMLNMKAKYNFIRGSEYTAPVSIVIAGIVWVICIPIYTDQVQNTNTTGWSFTGSSGAITLFNLMPFVFIAGGVVWILKKVL